MEGAKISEKKNRVSIYFDLDTKKLRDVYERTKGVSYTNAYLDIRRYMENEGYVHEQGSVYHSIDGKTNMDVIRCITEFQEKESWFANCVKKISYAQIGEKADLLPALGCVKKQRKQKLEKGERKKDIFTSKRVQRKKQKGKSR